jgi:hypothetical protein
MEGGERKGGSMEREREGGRACVCECSKRVSCHPKTRAIRRERERARAQRESESES